MAKHDLRGKNIQRKRADLPFLWRAKIDGEWKSGQTHSHNKAEAEKIAAAEIGKLRGRNAENKKLGLGEMLFSTACQNWIDEKGAANAASGSAGQITIVEWLRDVVADLYGNKLTCSEIRNTHVMAVRSRRQKTLNHWTGEPVGPRTINMTIVLFRCVLNHARKHHDVAIAPIDWAGKLLKIEDSEIVVVEGDVMKRILRTLRGDMHDVLMFALACGKRIDEMLSLTWGKIDLKQRTMTIRIKGGKVVKDHLGPVELAVLQRQQLLLGRERTGKDDPVFTFIAQRTGNYFHPKTKELVRHQVQGKRYPLAYGHLQDNLEAACADLAIEDVTIHVLRHTAATMVLRAKGMGGIHIAQRMLNHTTPVTTMKFYAKVCGEDVVAAKREVAGEITAMFSETFEARAEAPLKLITG